MASKRVPQRQVLRSRACSGESWISNMRAAFLAHGEGLADQSIGEYLYDQTVIIVILEICPLVILVLL